MTYLDKYKDCGKCPVEKYCGTMVGSIRLCNSYKEEEETEKPEEEYYPEMDVVYLSDGDLYR